MEGSINSSRHQICDLPVLVLINMLKFVSLQELLLNISKISKLFHTLINETSSFWNNFELDIPLELHREHLEHVLHHYIGIHIFSIPYSTLHVSSHELDFLFTTQLSRAYMYSLNIIGCRLSTLCFLKSFKHLKNLNISEYPNLVDEDLEAIAELPKLERIYISFTKIEPATSVRVCSSILNLSVLAISGIKLTVKHCAHVLTDQLQYFHLSLESQEDEIWFYGLTKRFINLTLHICTHITTRRYNMLSRGKILVQMALKATTTDYTSESRRTFTIRGSELTETDKLVKISIRSKLSEYITSTSPIPTTCRVNNSTSKRTNTTFN